MTVAEPAAAGIAAAPQRGVIGGLVARMAGLVMDVLLLAVFLAFGVACLNVLMAVVVLVVGVVASPPSNPEALRVELERARELATTPAGALAVFASDDYLSSHLRATLPDGFGYDDIREGVLDYTYRIDPAQRLAIRLKVDAFSLAIALGACAGLGVSWIAFLRLRRFLLTRLIDATFERFVSKRYLVSRSTGSLVNLVTIVSVAGVAVGVMALVVVISVMDGFDRTIMNNMLGVFGHVEVWPAALAEDFEFTEDETQAHMATLLATPGIKAVSPVLRRQTFFQVDTGINNERVGALLLGLDPELEKEVTRMTRPETIVQGSGVPGPREVVLGRVLAQRLGVRAGDRVYALGKVISTARGATPKISSMRVAGIFETGLYEVDNNFSYASAETVGSLFLAGGRTSYLHLAVDDPGKVEERADAVLEALPMGLNVRPWTEINREFFQALQVEKVAMFIILLMIVLVASLNIFGTLVMVATQKTREIGILKSMGASDWMILKIFLLHGSLVGMVGTTLGAAWGLWICRFVDRDIEKIFNLPGAIYGLSRLPVVVDPKVILVLTGASLGICVLASLIPAFRAARMRPVEALRYD